MSTSASCPTLGSTFWKFHCLCAILNGKRTWRGVTKLLKIAHNLHNVNTVLKRASRALCIRKSKMNEKDEELKWRRSRGHRRFRSPSKETSKLHALNFWNNYYIKSLYTGVHSHDSIAFVMLFTNLWLPQWHWRTHTYSRPRSRDSVWYAVWVRGSTFDHGGFAGLLRLDGASANVVQAC